MHAILKPLADELPTVLPGVGSVAGNVIIQEPSLVPGAIGPTELALALFVPHVVLTSIARAVRPLLNAIPMLLVIDPAAFVKGSV
jgi:hypothetical protein